MTVQISFISLILATILGFITGVLRTSKNKFIQYLIGIYVFIIRGTPFIVQIFIVFFVFPDWGIQLEAFYAAILAMTVMGGGFICEIIAGGIDAVDKGQWEAATSSGLTSFQALKFVIIPQSMKTILPPLVGEYVLLIKDSSVVSVIGIMDLTRVGWVTIARIPEGLMVFSLVGILYFAISYPLILLSNDLEKRMAVGV
jgi:polar amino acid transport system permease protein